jgi:hypothetical protein
VDEQIFLAERFQAHRSHLRGVAYRMLGSLSEAEDAVQETWLRLGRSESDDIANLGGVDDGGRPRLPGHASLPQVAARGLAGR